MGSVNRLSGIGAAICLLWLVCAIAPAAQADLSPYPFDPLLSLTGDCSKSEIDPVADPSCPEETPGGRFDKPRAIAIDAYGNEYVSSTADEATGRVSVFDDEGKFITEVLVSRAKSIAVDSQGNLYVYDVDGHIVRYPPSVFQPETGDLEYGNPPVPVAEGTLFGALTVDRSNDHLFVIQSGVLTEYDSAEEDNKEVDSIDLFEKIGSWTNSIAIDAQRERLFLSRCRDQVGVDCEVVVLEAKAPYSLLKVIDGSTTPAMKFASLFGWLSIGVDEETGYFFIDDLVGAKKIYEFDQDYEYVSQLSFDGFAGNSSMQIAVSNGENPAGVDALNRHYLFVPVLLQAGRALAFEPRGLEPPLIEGLATGSIGETEAELRAVIDPAGGEAGYVVEYTTEQAFEEKGFAGAQVADEGAIPGTSPAQQIKVTVKGLSPGVSYRFRVRVQNEAGGDEEEARFATYADPPVAFTGCSNSALRVGASEVLPDCRAYELVTPPDTLGRPPKEVGAAGDDVFPAVQVSPLGTSVSFNIEGGSLPGTNGSGSFKGDPYLATRGSSGWTSALHGPSGEQATVTNPGSVSPDQSYSFWTARVEGPAVVDGGYTSYVRYPDGHSELIGRGSLGSDPFVNGTLITEHGTHIIFQTVNTSPVVAQQLEPDAPPTGTKAVYDRTADEVTHVVSLLPGNKTPAAGEDAIYIGASVDGAGIAFEIDDTLYLRVANALTYEIGLNVEYAGIADGGKRIFYVEDGDLLAFDTEANEVIEFSKSGDVTPVNVARGGSRAYFVSPSVLTAKENPNGALPQGGEQNLYLSEEGQVSFVGTVTDRDVEGESTGSGTFDGLGLWTEVLARRPAADPSRLTPDGSVLLFQSRANLDDYDSGSSPQIYRYDHIGNRLQCISCIPTGAPATDGASLQTISLAPAAPPPLSSLGVVPNVRADGNRVFFESTEALVSYDTDEVQDIYEWEEQGVGSCTRVGGCVYLISSGHSPRNNYLYGHSSSGDDVFFSTSDVLTGFDSGGTPSLYDARVGGGFPEVSDEVCVGEGCRPDLTPPPPAATVVKPPHGDGNVRRFRCPKGKRKVKRNGRVRCVKKKDHKGKHRKVGAKKKRAAR